MTNLEFINMLINDITDAIKLRKIDAKVYEATDDTEEIKSNNFALKRLEEYLKQFQKIKEELEAWYLIKPDFVLSWDNPNDASGYYLKYFGDYEYEIINRAKRQN